MIEAYDQGADSQYEPEMPPEIPADEPVSLDVPMDKVDREELGRVIRSAIESYKNDTENRRGNLLEWRQSFECMPTGRSNRWANAADVPSNFIRSYCNSYSTRLNQQIIHTQPPVSVVARDPMVMDAVPAIEEAMQALLEEACWAEFADEVHNELPVAGNVFVRVTYEQKTKRVPRTNDINWDAEQFQSLTHAGLEPLDAAVHAVETDGQGRPKRQAILWETVTEKSGVCLEVIPWEDGIIMPATIRRPEDAYGIGERLMIRGTDLKVGAKHGFYIEEEVDALLERVGDGVPEYRHERLDQQGITSSATIGGQITDPLYRDYDCYNLCWQVDTDDDGEMEWVVVTIHYDTGRILRLKYLPYEHGKPYYTMIRLFTRPKELFGMGIAEIITCHHNAAVAILCQLVDAGDLKLNMLGGFFYDSTSGLDPDKALLELGKPIPVDDVRGILPFPQVGSFLDQFQLLQLLKDQCDTLTATSNPSLGRTTDSAKTLGEVQIVTGASNMIFEEVASRVARQWAKVFDQVRWLTAQYGAEDGKVMYRRSASPEYQIIPEGENQITATFKSIPADTLKAKVDLIPTGLKQLADMQSRIQQASLVRGTLMQDPLAASNPQIIAELDDVYLDAINFPRREKIMHLIRQQAMQMQQQQAAQQQMQQEMQQQALMSAGAAMDASANAGPGNSGGVPASGPHQNPLAPENAPENQGARGFPQGGMVGAATGPGGVPLPPQGGGTR